MNFEPSPRHWHVRPYQDGDAPGLLALYRLVFGRERTEADLRWKLMRGGTPEHTLWVADAAGQIVGQHAGIPMRLRIGGTDVDAIHAVEAMSHPEYRRQGMLSTLGGALYDHWRELGVPIIIGLPHEGWGTRAHALGYRPAFPMRWLSRPLRPLSILLSKLGHKSHTHHSSPRTTPSPHSALEIEFRDAPGAEFDTLWNTLKGVHSNAVVRDASWVKWRYFDPPGGPFRVLFAKRREEPRGYIAYRLAPVRNRQIGRVADVSTHPDDQEAARSLIRAATIDMRNQGADSAVILVAVGSPLFGTMRRNGFVLNRGEYSANFVRLSHEISEATLNDPRKWLLTGGDFDVV